MTIEEMRSAMREKVVPEEVVPQNVINCLIDEEAKPPKLDAFAFLTRLRALGIGSADFLNLLEGCGAPENTVNRIKQNPAMNLQGLVMTLENSELDSDDYTRMLLTARQVWERTLTMRLEKSEKLSRQIEKYDEDEDEPAAPAVIEEEPAEESPVVEEFDDYDEDMSELSFTAVFDKINSEMREADYNDLHSGKTAERIFEQAERENKHPEIYQEQAEDGSFEWDAGENEETAAPSEDEIPEIEEFSDFDECVVPEMSEEDYNFTSNVKPKKEFPKGKTDDLTIIEAFDKISVDPDEPKPPKADDPDLHSGKNAAKIFEEAETEEPSETEETDLEDIPEELEDGENLTELSFTQAFDKIKSKNAEKLAASETPEEETSVGDTTTIVQIDEEMLRESFEKLAEKVHTENEDRSEDKPNERVEEPNRAKTAKQAKSADKKPSKPVKSSRPKPEKPVKEPPEDTDEEQFEVTDNIEEPETAEAEEISEVSALTENGKVYHGGALIGGAVGAAALLAASWLIGAAIGKNDGKQLHYAKDNSEIFAKIYDAYSGSTAGGSEACGIDADYSAFFGDLLINDGEVGTFAINTEVYTVTEEAISGDIVNNGVVVPLSDILPPENSRFVAAFDGDGGLYAVFSGKQSGFIKVVNGTEDIKVLQDGVLTDFEHDGDIIKLGTVYTPNFEHTFTLADEEVYLPKMGAQIMGEDNVKPISVKNVLISSGEGYSYGVSADYSTDSGEVKSSQAVIGDPVAASADGRFALNGNKGLIVKTDNGKFTSRSTELISRAAFGKNACAVTERENAGKIKLFGEDLKLGSMLTGTPEKINEMWFDGAYLTVSGDTDSVFRVDCAKPQSPEPLTLTTASGIISGNSALIYQTEDGKLTITRYDLKDGVCEKRAEYSKELSAESLSSVKPGEPKAAFIDGDNTGAAYSYFDGVSVISEYVVFAEGAEPKTVSVYDDKTGFSAAFKIGGEINAVCAEGVKVPQ